MAAQLQVDALLAQYYSDEICVELPEAGLLEQRKTDASNWRVKAQAVLENKLSRDLKAEYQVCFSIQPVPEVLALTEFP